MPVEISEIRPVRNSLRMNLRNPIELSPSADRTPVTTVSPGTSPWGAPMKSASGPRLLPLIPGSVFPITGPEAMPATARAAPAF